MGWLEEQIRQRKAMDDALFADSIEDIAGAVTGEKRKGTTDEVSSDAVLAILKYYGFKGKSEIPREVTDFHERLTYMCRPFGVMFRLVRLTEGWWKDCMGPILAFRKEDGSAAALLPHGFGYAFREDGKAVGLSRKNWECFEEEAYCFYKPFPDRALSPADLLKYAIMTRSVKDVVVVLALMAVATLVGLLTPRLSYFLYNHVVGSGSVSLLLSTVFFLLCVSVSRILFNRFQSLYNGIISNKMDVSVKAATMMRILSLPPKFFRNYSAGEISQRSNHLTSLTKTLTDLVFTAGLTSVFSLAYIRSIFEYAPGLVVPSLVIILVTVAFSLTVTFARQKLSREQMEISAKESGMTYAMISGIRKIKIAGAEKRAFARWAKLYSREAALTYDPPMFLRVDSVITLAISAAGTLAMYYFALETGVDLAEYTAFSAAYGMVSGAFLTMAGYAGSCASVKPVLDMARPIMECVPEVSENRKIVTKVQGKIELSNVSFAYDENSPLIIDNLSLTVQPGQYIAIVGKTGCGKSTLVRLLLGFEKPKRGTVYYDGQDINSLDLKSLRRRIGVVMQDSGLFHGDIFSNITISAPQLTLDDAWEAARIAGIADDIAAMPMGMHTVISEGSGGISGGQKQRLVIARAIAPKPKILIFDEATSALDNLTQKKISEALDRLNCTRIIIAHRLSTIRRCDRILYLEGGKIVEDGTYEELVAKQGLFAKLVERQRLDT